MSQNARTTLAFSTNRSIILAHPDLTEHSAHVRVRLDMPSKGAHKFTSFDC